MTHFADALMFYSLAINALIKLTIYGNIKNLLIMPTRRNIQDIFFVFRSVTKLLLKFNIHNENFSELFLKDLLYCIVKDVFGLKNINQRKGLQT